MPIMRDYKKRRDWYVKDDDSTPQKEAQRGLGELLMVRRRLERLAAALLAVSILALGNFLYQGGFQTAAHWFGQIALWSDEQSSALAAAEARLAQLDSVLANKNKSIEERQLALDALRNEHAALRRVLVVDRLSVDEIFAQEKARNEQDIWKERGVSFLLGILSGLLTALIARWLNI
jgi:hypothetical protein